MLQQHLCKILRCSDWQLRKTSSLLRALSLLPGFSTCTLIKSVRLPVVLIIISISRITNAQVILCVVTPMHTLHYSAVFSTTKKYVQC